MNELNEYKLRKRKTEIEAWLYAVAPECFKEQEHLTVLGVEEKPTPERIYWHYGYMMAVKDILAIFEQSHGDDLCAQGDHYVVDGFCTACGLKQP